MKKVKFRWIVITMLLASCAKEAAKTPEATPQQTAFPFLAVGNEWKYDDVSSATLDTTENYYTQKVTSKPGVNTYELFNSEGKHNFTCTVADNQLNPFKCAINISHKLKNSYSTGEWWKEGEVMLK